MTASIQNIGVLARCIRELQELGLLRLLCH